MSATPETVRVEDHFAGKAAIVRETYDRALAVLGTIGSFRRL